MTLAVESHPTKPILEVPVMRGVSWKTYQSLRRELDEAGSHLKIAYDRGRMVVYMSPLPIHDKWKRMTGQLVEALADELDIPISAYGSTTWKREDLARGLEADECYYVQHAQDIRGKMDFDLTVDPPPDLAIEVHVTHDPIDKPSIYAALGVPELWRYDGRAMRAFVRNENGGYRPVETSLAFPALKPAELHRFLLMYPASLDLEIVRAFRQWVRSVLKRS